MKRQKMITLCPTTYEIAQAMPNFSQWVREQLKYANSSKRSPQLVRYTYDCIWCDTRFTLDHRDDFFYCVRDGCNNPTRIVGQKVVE
jgi:hypothetical protein